MIILLPTEPFELARHSSTASNECIEHGPGGGRPTFESELEEYEENIIIDEPVKDKVDNDIKASGTEEGGATALTEECDNDRKRYSSSIHHKGK